MQLHTVSSQLMSPNLISFEASALSFALYSIVPCISTSMSWSLWSSVVRVWVEWWGSRDVVHGLLSMVIIGGIFFAFQVDSEDASCLWKIVARLIWGEIRRSPSDITAENLTFPAGSVYCHSIMITQTFFILSLATAVVSQSSVSGLLLWKVQLTFQIPRPWV